MDRFELRMMWWLGIRLFAMKYGMSTLEPNGGRLPTRGIGKALSRRC